MKLNKLILAAILYIFSLFLFSCNESEASSMNGNWVTMGFEIKGELQEVVESDMYLEHSSGKTFNVTGCSGVNRYSGTVKVTDSTLKFDEKMAMTKMAADPESMAFEDNFINCLMNSDVYSVTESNGSKYLIIENTSDGMKLTFKKVN